MQKRPHQQNGGTPFLPAFFCILFFTILGYFRKYFEKKIEKMVENEGFGYEVAMKGGYEVFYLFLLFWTVFYENIEKKLKKRSVLTSFCSGKCACGATFSAIFTCSWPQPRTLFFKIFPKITQNRIPKSSKKRPHQQRGASRPFWRVLFSEVLGRHSMTPWLWASSK